MPNRFRTAHRLISVGIALAIPVTVYLVNGVAEPWTFVLGAVIGFSYWYFFPIILP